MNIYPKIFAAALGDLLFAVVALVLAGALATAAERWKWRHYQEGFWAGVITGTLQVLALVALLAAVLLVVLGLGTVWRGGWIG